MVSWAQLEQLPSTKFEVTIGHYLKIYLFNKYCVIIIFVYFDHTQQGSGLTSPDSALSDEVLVIKLQLAKYKATTLPSVLLLKLLCKIVQMFHITELEKFMIFCLLLKLN